MWGRLRDPLGWLFGVDEDDRGAFADFSLVEALLLQGVALGQAGVPGYLTDAKMLVEENGVAALLLDEMMVLRSTPTHHGFLVAPA